LRKNFSPKWVSHILKLREAFSGQAIFGRSDAMEVIAIKSSRASELLKEMAEHGALNQYLVMAKGNTDSESVKIEAMKIS
jgi:hypothetical protein